MDDPTRLELSDPGVREVGVVFGTPLVIKGFSAFPFTQLVVWWLMTWRAGRLSQKRTWTQRARVGLFSTVALLGAEWGHNLAHAAAAQTVGKPMELVRILWGMPRLQYHDVNDLSVTPGQHILRALGGPLFNALLLPAFLLWRRKARPDSDAHEVATVAIATNAFIASVGLLPLPMIDGGPLLKWGLVSRGRSVHQANEIVRQVDGVLAAICAVAGLLAVKRRGAALGLFSWMMALTSFAYWRGWLKE